MNVSFRSPPTSVYATPDSKSESSSAQSRWYPYIMSHKTRTIGTELHTSIVIVFPSGYIVYPANWLHPSGNAEVTCVTYCDGQISRIRRSSPSIGGEFNFRSTSGSGIPRSTEGKSPSRGRISTPSEAGDTTTPSDRGTGSPDSTITSHSSESFARSALTPTSTIGYTG